MQPQPLPKRFIKNIKKILQSVNIRQNSIVSGNELNTIWQQQQMNSVGKGLNPYDGTQWNDPKTKKRRKKQKR